MAALATELRKLNEYSDTLKLAISSHTAAKPRVVIQKRTTPSGNQVMLTDTVKIVYGTIHPDASPHEQNVILTLTMSRPKDGDLGDLYAARGLMSEIIACDEFVDIMNNQYYLPVVESFTP